MPLFCGKNKLKASTSKNKSSTLPFFSRAGSHEIVINPITFGAFNKLPFIKKDEISDLETFAQYKAAIFECTDISIEEFENFRAPDFNQLGADIQEFINTPSNLLTGHEINGETHSFELLFPFKNEIDEEFTRIRFQVPTVGHCEKLAGILDPIEREEFMFRVVCNLEKQDLDLMAMNDHLAIKPQVSNFFTQSAAFFPRATAKR